MASNTENLDLLMKNPSTDGADTFNIQTMLNENWQKIDNNAGTVAQTLANILKPTTPPIIGLPSSTTPDGMFNVLAHAGDLHVWRKTVVTKEPVPEVPGSYKLGPSEQLIVATRTFANSNYESYVEGVLASNAITIDLDGKVTLTDPAEVSLYIYNRRDGVTSQTGREAISGYSYFLIPSTSASSIGCEISMPRDTIYYIPSTSSYYRTSSSSGGQSSFDAAQLVTGVPGTPEIPAGTTVTYPVSTNRNAYQEGNDAKPAGYVVGDAKTGSFKLCPVTGDTTFWDYGTNLNVADDGTITIKDKQSLTLTTSSTVSNVNVLKGKFVKPLGVVPSPFANGKMYFIPTDAAISKNKTLLVNKYQPVTGYAAIPANTTIEYLGKLGDKARVQVVSYVGTGTYGSSNPCSLTFDFVPKFFAIMCDDDYYSRNAFAIRGAKYMGYRFDGNTRAIDITWEGAKFSWYSYTNASIQYNENGNTYYAVAFG